MGLLFGVASSVAQQPLYIVNGVERSSVEGINPDVIERIEELPADEETIARYGQRASNGVVLIALKYDQEARFPQCEGSLANYLAGVIAWDETDSTARVVLRYRIDAEGRLSVVQELEVSDRRFLRRVLKALESSPRWEPARKLGEAVESEGILRLQLPAGRAMPPKIELVIR
ncbi:MAG: TonB-dependent receptor [Alistipes sp.]|nr:TonB-dependent receptor [Alistipes sp.]